MKPFLPHIKSSKPTVVVGMSGGVDSSVSALLLKDQGYQVIGLFMRNWEEEEGPCPATEDYEDVIDVCSQLNIPYYPVNFIREYWERVFSKCLKEYKLGFTPNPDIFCNQEIKFKIFLEKALEIGADYLATGHYCRHLTDGSHHFLGRGVDHTKDQSYFLYTMRQQALKKVLFPLGDLQKRYVRSIAEEHNLCTAKKRDSTGICFIGKRPFKEFLNRYIEKTPGNFETLDGKIIGQHDGISFYTIGQRKGLDIGGPGEAWFVASKDPARNVIHLVQGETHPALFHTHLTAQDLHWVSDFPPSLPLTCTAKIRYRSEDATCVLETIENGTAIVRFDRAQKAITERQSIVFYQGEICLGGGLIHSAYNDHKEAR